MMQCIKCDKSIPDDAVYCPYCGKPQTPPKRSGRTNGNGLGSVYKEGGGTWTAEATLGWAMDEGKLKRKKHKKRGFKTKKAAIEYLADLRRQAEKPKKVTISELHEALLESLENLSKTKQDAYKIAWKKIKDYVGYRQIDSLTVKDLQDLTDNAGSSYYTKRDIKILLSKIYEIAIRDDYCDKNRAQYIELPPLETKERKIFDESEIEKIWKCYSEAADVTACRMLIMLYTGIRPGELSTIRTENINLDEQWMTGGIKTEKGKRRKIIIPDCIVPLIQYSIQQSKDGLLAKYAKNRLYDDWNALRDRLGIRKELTPYCCRHTYITRLTALRVSPAMLQELAGHEDYDTTLYYTHLSVADRLAEVNRLDHPAMG